MYLLMHTEEKQTVTSKTLFKRILFILVVSILTISIMLKYTNVTVILLPEIKCCAITNKMFKYLNNGDVDSFSDLFCDAARTTPDFNSCIQALFSEFEGEFTDEALEEIHTNYGFHTGTNFDYGKITKFEWSNKYIDVNTNSGNSYVFYVEGYLVNDDNPEFKGVTAFTMKPANDEEKRVGFITKSI